MRGVSAQNPLSLSEPGPGINFRPLDDHCNLPLPHSIMGGNPQGTTGPGPLKGINMKHLTSLTQAPQPAESIFRAMLETKRELMEDNSLLKQLF